MGGFVNEDGDLREYHLPCHYNVFSKLTVYWSYFKRKIDGRPHWMPPAPAWRQPGYLLVENAGKENARRDKVCFFPGRKKGRA